MSMECKEILTSIAGKHSTWNQHRKSIKSVCTTTIDFGDRLIHDLISGKLFKIEWTAELFQPLNFHSIRIYVNVYLDVYYNYLHLINVEETRSFKWIFEHFDLFFIFYYSFAFWQQNLTQKQISILLIIHKIGFDAQLHMQCCLNAVKGKITTMISSNFTQKSQALLRLFNLKISWKAIISGFELNVLKSVRIEHKHWSF